MEELLVLVLAVMGVVANGNLEECAYSPATTWTVYEGGRPLQCVGRSQWWRRDSSDGTASCPLQEDEWRRVTECSDSRDCRVDVNPSTVSLEYCCTSGENPAVATQLECFILQVCPNITSVTVPQQLFAGSYVYLYLTMASYPPSFTDPLITHTTLEDPHFPSTVPPDITTYTNFFNVTVAYSFTVPVSGHIHLDLNYISSSLNSLCQNPSASLNERLYQMEIVEADTETALPPTQPPLCSPSAGHVSSVTGSSVTPSAFHSLPTSSPSSPPLSPSTIHLSPSSTHPSPSSSPSSSPHSKPPSVTNIGCPSQNEGEGLWMVGVGICGLVLAVILTVVVVGMGLWVCHLRARLSRVLSFSAKSSGVSTPVDSPTEDNKRAIIHSFSAPDLPSSPPPHSHSPSTPSLPPPLPPHHHIITGSHEDSVDSGAVVTAPPRDSSSIIYSTPFHNGSTHSTPCHNSTPHLSPCHTLTSLRHPSLSRPSEPGYAFIDGRLIKVENEVLHLDPIRNIGSARNI